MCLHLKIKNFLKSCKPHVLCCGWKNASYSDLPQIIHSNLKSRLCSTLHTWLEWTRENIGNNKNAKHAPFRAQIALFSRRQVGVNQSLQRTDSQWLYSNLWGGRVTILFLAPHSRVSVSCGSYQLPALMIGPQPSHPPVSTAVFQFSCPTHVTVASCRRGSAFKRRDWQNTRYTHARMH